jgi:glutathione S-transferase
MSGQGPYYGQLAWFKFFHSEKLPSAVERYTKEMERVIGVLDAHLKKQGSQFLVGDKCTYADTAFVTWGSNVPWLTTGDDPKIDIEGKYPSYDAWLKRVCERPAVKKVLADKAKAAGK